MNIKAADLSPGTDEVSLYSVAADLLRHSRAIIIAALLGASLLGGFTLLRPRMHRASASFVPQMAEGANQLSGLAAQFGVTIGGGTAGASPPFYAKLLESRSIGLSIINTRYAFDDAGERIAGDLYDIWEIEEADPQARMDEALRALHDAMEVSTDLEAGTVEFKVATRWAALSEAIATRALELLVDFDMSSRQTQASAERRFVEERLAEARRELKEAEDAVSQFLRQNRDYQSSPTLLIEHQRLVTEMTMRQQLMTVLTQNFEQARIEEVRNTPRVTVIEHPAGSAVPQRNQLVLFAIAGAVLGVLVAATAALLWEFHLRSQTRDPMAYARFRAAVERTPFRFLAPARQRNRVG